MFLNYLKFKPAYLLVFTILIASCSDDDALLGVDSPIAVSFDTDSKMVEVEEKNIDNYVARQEQMMKNH